MVFGLEVQNDRRRLGLGDGRIDQEWARQRGTGRGWPSGGGVAAASAQGSFARQQRRKRVPVQERRVIFREA